ncbi:hypothetical protein AL755_04905 [Arthrobacter sp. ERGS1:01]|uniref:NADH-ubiquinone oxidoreductase-F iron-sulfur binding region domain-containing protein n=1 Tax=Arthrobacter sp. ERGS1:01 TaxID=1704044 RepID=UPI0006B473F6|nr:NADH-ubiquinone oxidoreductase-F iron-sulfur binding region domain-containing protein [Arthrobacter sp. ERGS1:01]ALE04982.1 hypothetical protein AL755_04905 [Arthrobacter sp. ERGS1:01]
MTARVEEPVDETVPALGATRLFAAGGQAGYATHRATFGELPWRELETTFLPELEASGLSGRGGAAFPAWRKMALLAGARRTGRRVPRASTPVLIANGAEGEPLSVKDATLLHNAPHLVIDGLLAAAKVTGARTIFIYTGVGNLAPVTTALAERDDAGAVTLVEAPDTFVAGQSSAVVNFLETGRALPRTMATRLGEAGFKGRPTLLSNVESWAHMALIARYGAAWFRAQGTQPDPGTRLVSISGDVPAETVLEVPGGAPLEAVLASAGVGPDAVGAVLVGGFHGRWVRPAGMRLAAGEQSAQSVRPGAGVLHVLGHGRCGLAATATMVSYLAGESARQCGPCLFGLPALAGLMGRLAAGAGAGRADADLVAEVQRMGELVAGRGACHHPDGTVQLIRSALETFADDVPWHLAGQCLAGQHLAEGGSR